MNYDAVLNQVVQALVTAILPILLGVIVYGLKQVADNIRARVGQAHWNMAQQITRAAVLASEQVGLIEELEITGQKKKRLAIDFVQAALKKQGINLDVETIAGLIETEVFEEFNRYYELEETAG